MISHNELSLVFDKEDFLEAKELFIDDTTRDFAHTACSGVDLRDGSILPTIIVPLGKVSIPVLGGLIALWLGRGKQITLKSGKRQLSLKNIKESSAEEIIKLFLKEEGNGLE